MNAYAISTLVRLSGSFYALPASVLTDPTTVALTLTDPTGAVTAVASGAIVRDGTGLYHYDWAGALAGVWQYQWQGTGAVLAASFPTNVRLE